MATWSLSVFCEYEDGSQSLLGSTGGRVLTDPQSPAFVGVTQLSSFTAEVQAQVLARLYLCQTSMIPHGSSVEIIFDSMSADDCCRGVGGSSGCQLAQVFSLILNQHLATKFSISSAHVLASDL